MVKTFLIRIVVTVVCLSLGCATVAASPEKVSEHLFFEQLGENIFLIDHQFPWPANSLAVKIDNTVVLIDTPYTSEASKTIVERIRKIWSPAKIIAVNTGFHVDNLGGNGYLVDIGIPVFGSKLTCELLDQKGEASRALMLSWLKGPAHKVFYKGHQTPYIKPTEIFTIKPDEVYTLLEGKIQIYYPGESHSPDNLVVYLPELKLLFGGCMVKSLESKNLGNTADANLGEWPVSVQKVLDKYAEAEIVVPGHGKWGGIELLRHTINLCNN